jgi:hypothetical protein
MNIIKLPTDNLYKFISLSGLLLCIASFVFLEWYVFELQRRSFETLREVKQLFLDVDELTGDYYVEPESKTQEIEQNKFFSLDTLESKVREIENSMREDNRQLDKDVTNKNLEREVALNVKRKNLDIVYKAQMLGWYYRVARETRIIAISGILIGGLFMSVGFVLWYINIQRYQDQSLRNRVKVRSN